MGSEGILLASGCKAHEITVFSKIDTTISVIKSVKRGFEMQLLFDDSNQHVGGHGAPDLRLHGALAGAQQALNAEVFAIQGKYYPPFNAEILSRKILLTNPPNTLLIASKTFGDRLKKDLIGQGLFSKLHTLAELS